MFCCCGGCCCLPFCFMRYHRNKNREFSLNIICASRRELCVGICKESVVINFTSVMMRNPLFCCSRLLSVSNDNLSYVGEVLTSTRAFIFVFETRRNWFLFAVKCIKLKCIDCLSLFNCEMGQIVIQRMQDNPCWVGLRMDFFLFYIHAEIKYECGGFVVIFCCLVLSDFWN